MKQIYTLQSCYFNNDFLVNVNHKDFQVWCKNLTVEKMASWTDESLTEVESFKESYCNTKRDYKQVNCKVTPEVKELINENYTQKASAVLMLMFLIETQL